MTSIREPPIGALSRARHSLSHLDKYDRISKAAYLAFKGHLYAKLEINQAAIGGKSEMVLLNSRELI
jgi:hypothetical protein